MTGDVTLQSLRTQNFGRHEPLVYRALRRVTVLLSYACIRLGISPNTITVLSTLAAAVAACLLAVGRPTPVRWGSAVIVLSFALDCVDGEVARATKRESVLGIQLEHITSWLIIGLLQGGAAIGVLRYRHDLALIVAAFSSLVGWYALYFLFLQLRLWIPRDAEFGALRRLSRGVYRVMPLDQNLLIILAASDAVDAYLLMNAVIAPLLSCVSFFLFWYYTRKESMVDSARREVSTVGELAGLRRA